MVRSKKPSLVPVSLWQEAFRGQKTRAQRDISQSSLLNPSSLMI